LTLSISGFKVAGLPDGRLRPLSIAFELAGLLHRRFAFLQRADPRLALMPVRRAFAS
jgi:hypothetical protein